MEIKYIIGAACAINFALCSTASAASFSFTGTFSADDDVQLFNFTAGGASTVTMRTYSYAGGVQADGNVVSAGGFDPILALFDNAGNFIGQNDDGAIGTVSTDPNTIEAWDTYLDVALVAGNYTVAIMQYDNFALGPTLSDGFLQTGNPFFTGTLGNCSNGQFCDVSGVNPYNNRTNEWAFDVLNVATASVVPIPAAAWLFGSGLIGLIGVARRKRS